MKKFIFELNNDDIAKQCDKQYLCTTCPLMTEFGICAKDFKIDLKTLLQYLLKEITL